jgi:hypothetical protein
MPQTAIESYALDIDADVYAAVLRQAADAVLARLNSKLATETAARQSADSILSTRIGEVEVDVVTLQADVDLLKSSKLDTISLETQFRDWLNRPEQLALLEGAVMSWNGGSYSVSSVLASLLAKPIIVSTAVVSRDTDYYPVTMRTTLAAGQVCIFGRAVEVVAAADPVEGIFERRRYTYTCPDFAGQSVAQSLTCDIVPVYSLAEPGMVLFTHPQVVERTNILFDLTAGFTGRTTVPLSPLDLNADGHIGAVPPPPNPEPVPSPTPAPAPEPAPAPAPGAAELIALQAAQQGLQSANADVTTADALADQTEASAAQAVAARDAAQQALTDAQAGGDAQVIATAQAEYDAAAAHAASVTAQAEQQRAHVGTLETIAAAAQQTVDNAQAAYNAAIAG